MPDDSMWKDNSRRKLLKSTGAVIAGGMLAGCSDDASSSNDSSGDGSGNTTTAPAKPSYHAKIPEYEIESTVVPHIAAIREILPEATDDRMTAETTRFTDNPIAYKSMLTGNVDIFKGAPIMVYHGIKSGSQPRVIGTNVGGSDYVMVVSKEVGGFQDFKNSDLRFGISSKGSISHTQPVGVFSKEGIKESEVNFAKIGGSSARTQAVAAGKIDGAALHLEQFQRLKEEDAPVKNLALIQDYYPNFIVNCLAAQKGFLDEHEEFVQAYMNAVVKANKKATEDFDWFHSTMQKYFAEPMSKDSSKEVWDLLANTVNAWPHTKDTFGTKPYDEQMKLYQAAGLLEGDIDLDTMLVRKYWDNAVDNL